MTAQWIDGVLHLSITQPVDRPSPAPTPLQTPMASRSGSPKMRASAFALSSIPDEKDFAKKMGSNEASGSEVNAKGSEGVKGMEGL